MRVKIEERNSLPLVRYETESGGHYALLDTGSDNTITYYEKESGENSVTVVGFSGKKKSSVQTGKCEFDLVDLDENKTQMECDVVLVNREFFDVFEDNGLGEVEMIIGMNFFKKYKAKIDIKNKILILN